MSTYGQLELLQLTSTTSRRSRGPTAFWPEVEALFLRAKQDVLIVMDCCYSGQGGRAQKFTKTNHIEIFASCHNYGEANAPGPHSFTAHFIAETRRLLDHYRCVVTTSLFALLRQTINRQTPVHSSIDPLREPDQRTMIMGIQLQPLTEEDKDLTYMSEITATRFELSIDLSVSLDDDYMLKLINWLTTFRPQEVLRIEATSITHLKHRASLQGQLDFADVVNGCRSKMSQMNAPLRSPAIVPELPSMGFDSWSNDSSICPHPDQLTCQAPEGRNSTLVSLADIITGTGVNAPPSFEHRLGLAVTLGEKFRRGEVPDWGQQIVGSDSLLFSRNPGVETVDYSRPYFENNSAQEAAPSRLYLLELLEGESRKVVAYGIILLELGLWRLDTDIFPIRGMSVAEFENHVEDQMNWLKFHMGTQYHLAAKLCLAVADHAVQFHLTDDGKCHKAQDMLDKAIESLNSVRL